MFESTLVLASASDYLFLIW